MAFPMNETTLPSHTDPLAGQPYQVVERDGVRYTLLGTAHVSKTSVDTVALTTRSQSSWMLVACMH